MKKNKININVNELRTAILKKFGTYKKCADALKITDDNFANKMKRLSSKFLYQLKAIGVEVPPIDYGFTIELKDGVIKENPQQYNGDTELLQVKKELSEIKKMLSISIDKINELEKENYKLRVENIALLKSMDVKSNKDFNKK